VGARRDPDEILRERARALSAREGEGPGPTEELVTFTIGGHTFAVAVGQVLRAAALRHFTEIPGGPPYLIGVTGVEGHLVSLLDLTQFVGLVRHGVGDVTVCLVVGRASRELGLAVEQLLGIEDVPTREITPNPSGGPLTRVATIGARRLLIVDLERLLDDPRLGLG
jgi:chemotaxis signal transduction protein